MKLSLPGSSGKKMGLLCAIEEGSTIRVFSKTWHSSHLNRPVLTSQTLPLKPSSSAPNSFPCSTTPNWRSMPRPKLSRSRPSKPHSKPPSTAKPRSLLQSKRNGQPGQPVGKPAQPCGIRLLKLKLALLNSNAVPKGWGRLPGPQASTLIPCSTSSPLGNCVSIMQTSPGNGTLYSNSNAKPLCKTFNPLKASKSTRAELTP